MCVYRRLLVKYQFIINESLKCCGCENKFCLISKKIKIRINIYCAFVPILKCSNFRVCQQGTNPKNTVCMYITLIFNPMFKINFYYHHNANGRWHFICKHNYHQPDSHSSPLHLVVSLLQTSPYSFDSWLHSVIPQTLTYTERVRYRLL